MEILCVKPHSKGMVTVGTFYPLLDVKSCSCCGVALVNVGIKAIRPTSRCRCDTVVPSNGIYWLGAALFATCEDVVAEEVSSLELQS